MIPRLPLAALTLALAVTPPFRTEEPHVRSGNARLAAGDPAAALRLYDDAERGVGAHPELDLDRGHAALAAGDLAGAVDAWRRAASSAPPALASRALQNVGTALAAGGDRDGALRALADALARDPSNEDARWNLEVVLRRGAAGEAPPRDRDEALPSSRGGVDAAPAQGEERPGSAGERASASEEDRSDAPKGDRDARPAGERRERLSRREAEALLDALRARERNAPFAPRGEREGEGEGGRADAAKDW